MAESDQVAQGVLDRLQEAFTSHDLAGLLRLLDDEVVLFGTAAANLDRAQTVDYVTPLLDQQGTLRWDWDQVVVVLDAPGVLVFTALGTVGLDDEQGEPHGGRDAFRLTCVAVLGDDRWRIRHFHGSVPQLG